MYYNQKDDRPDGLVIALKKSKLEGIGDAKVVHYNDIKAKHPMDYLYEGYIGQILLCRVKGTDNYFLIGNTHLLAMVGRDARVGAISMLIQQLGELREMYKDKKLATIICGDLNETPREGTICRLRNFPVNTDHEYNYIKENIKGFLVDYPCVLPLKSAYAGYIKDDKDKLNEGHPEYTNYTVDYVATLDYIFYDYKYSYYIH